MSSPHGHPRHQPFTQQYQFQPHATPSPPTHTPTHQTPPFASPGLSTSPTLTFRAPSHSHPPIPTYSGSPHHAPPPNHTSDSKPKPSPNPNPNPTPSHPDQEPYYDHAVTPMLRQQSQQAHPSFLPIFTLIEDSTSQEHFHPKVHYIFEDDVDTPLDIALGSRAAPQLQEEKSQQPPEDQGHKWSRRRKGKPLPNDTAEGTADVDAIGWPRNIRPILVQISQDLTHVERAYSLAPEWQLTNVQVGKAPQWLVGEEFSAGGVGSVSSVTGQGLGAGGSGGGIGGGAGGNGLMGLQGQADQPQEGLMLTIEGTSIPDPNKKGNLGAATGAGAGESLYDLANSFADRMSIIKRVIEFGQQQEYEEQDRQRERYNQQREEQELWNQAQQYQDGVGGLGLGYDYGVPQGQGRVDQTQGYQGQYERDDRQGRGWGRGAKMLDRRKGKGRGRAKARAVMGVMPIELHILRNCLEVKYKKRM
ncbi:hypothetical protein BGX38DRAFT_430318 [Terfezia claveryi]|nr:hypothetical protein BGX38DRAFT_430318 [Terfezia claveryi]